MNSVPSSHTLPVSPRKTFAWQTRIYYEDTDAGGIVFYANYLKFFERARTEWLRAGGIDQSRLSMDTGTLFVVRRTSIDYFAPARLDDMLRIESHVARMGRASVEFEQHAFRAGERLCSGTILVACVSAATWRPTGLPPAVIAALQHE